MCRVAANVMSKWKSVDVHFCFAPVLLSLQLAAVTSLAPAAPPLPGCMIGVASLVMADALAEMYAEMRLHQLVSACID